jgi:hypothetical protein
VGRRRQPDIAVFRISNTHRMAPGDSECGKSTDGSGALFVICNPRKIRLEMPTRKQMIEKTNQTVRTYLRTY